MYFQDFIELVKAAKNINFYIGTGNPEAKILIIGKEAAINKLDNKGKRQYTREFENNISDWERDKEKAPSEVANWDLTNYSPLYPYKGQQFKVDQNGNSGTSRTWYNYQKLCNLIYPNSANHTINFHEKFFITEANSSTSKKTFKADKSSLSGRKEFIKSSSFFQNFPVIIIAGLGYFITTGKNEIEEIFKVQFHEVKCAANKQSQAYWIHYGIDKMKPKLLINTRQLSMNVSDDLLREISDLIRWFLPKG